MTFIYDGTKNLWYGGADVHLRWQRRSCLLSILISCLPSSSISPRTTSPPPPASPSICNFCLLLPSPSCLSPSTPRRSEALVFSFEDCLRQTAVYHRAYPHLLEVTMVVTRGGLTEVLNLLIFSTYTSVSIKNSSMIPNEE
ncbi:hypothetical protein K1719_009905 [Acacia pycnantha]|nr:hypothetical protein K1719_009905 [Acacia pycnantha]